MVMDCFVCSFDIHVRLYSWLHKCNSCDIAILLFQSFLCSCSSYMVVQLAAQVQQLRHHHFLLSMSRLGGPRLEGEDTVTGPSATHYIFSFSPFFPSLAINSVFLRKTTIPSFPPSVARRCVHPSFRSVLRHSGRWQSIRLVVPLDYDPIHEWIS